MTGDLPNRKLVENMARAIVTMLPPHRSICIAITSNNEQYFYIAQNVHNHKIPLILYIHFS